MLGRLILQAFLVSILFLAMYIGWTSHQKYQLLNSSTQRINYSEQRLNFSSLWGSHQFHNYYSTLPKLKFQSTSTSLKVETLKTQIQFSKIGIRQQDAKYLQDVVLLNKNQQILLVKGTYYSFVYSGKTEEKVYETVATQTNTEYYFADDEGKLWIFTHPNNNVIVLRVYDCEKQKLIFSVKKALPSKIQMISKINSESGYVKIKALTFSRNYFIYEFDAKTFELSSFEQIQAFSIEYFLREALAVETQISQKIKQTESYITLQQFLSTLSFGLAGHERIDPQIKKQQEHDYEIQALDIGNDIILQFAKQKNNTNIISFGDVLIPMRSPIFVNKQDYEKMLPIDAALNKSQIQPLPLFDIKMYGIKSKTLQIIHNQAGIYRLVPDAKVHFVTFDNEYFNFYPRENLNQEDYYAVRIPSGGVVFKGSSLQGIFSDIPISQKDNEGIVFGYDTNEVYIEQTTNAGQVVPSVYEAHIAHKGMFTSLRKNKVQLITIASGKPLLSHEISYKKGYSYSGSFIENNQFWVFQHKTGQNAIITKYEMFLNASSPKNLLYIKRQYDLNVQGRITRVQKCIDFFYYFTYATDSGKFGIARIHHALMSNRQAKADQKYAGAFERSMIIKNIQRNTKLNISSLEEQLLKVQISFNNPHIVESWDELQFKHQYKVLPMRVYKWKNSYFTFNLRKIMMNQYEKQIVQIQKQIISSFLTYSVAIGLLFVFILMVVGVLKGKGVDQQQQDKQDKTKKEEPKKKQQNAAPPIIQKNKDSPKKQKSTKQSKKKK